VLELGTVLKLKQAQTDVLGLESLSHSHSLFSRLIFKSGDGQKGQQVDEDGVADEDQLTAEHELNLGLAKTPGDEDGATGNWLENDDIEEF
jgi:hypothetical protein